MCTIFLAKYGSLDLCDEDVKKIFIVDHEEHHFDKNDGRTLILFPDEPNVLIFDHECFCIHKDIFDRIQSTHQKENNNIEYYIK